MKTPLKKSLIFAATGLIVLLAFILWSSTGSPKTYELVWQDEFSKDGLPNSDKWSYDVGDACDLPAGCGWGNNELQYYTDKRLDNARVEGGHLIIELHKEKYKSRDYTSARLTTKDKADLKYGKFEIKAKLPPGKGVWSAIWMLSSEDKYNGWPHSGEIDIMENVGYDPYTIHGTAHTLDYHHSIGTQKSGDIEVQDAYDTFHVYSVEWEPNSYSVFVDGTKYFTFENEGKDYKSWPFDQKFHLILNIAYGGNWGGKMGVDPSTLPTKMYVDYVRVFQKQ